MRHPRLKPSGRDVFYHTYNRVAGDPGDRPFADVEKEHFVSLLHKLSQLYIVEVVGYTVMASIKAAGKPLPFSTVATRRMRYWADGLVIGSRRFVTEIMSAARGAEHLGKRRFAAAQDAALAGVELVCYKRLRDLKL